jgi:hypothetical protein
MVEAFLNLQLASSCPLVFTRVPIQIGTVSELIRSSFGFLLVTQVTISQLLFCAVMDGIGLVLK